MSARRFQNCVPDDPQVGDMVSDPFGLAFARGDRGWDQVSLSRAPLLGLTDEQLRERLDTLKHSSVAGVAAQLIADTIAATSRKCGLPTPSDTKLSLARALVARSPDGILSIAQATEALKFWKRVGVPTQPPPAIADLVPRIKAWIESGAPSEAVCDTCDDTHTMQFGERPARMCTRCPVPCEQCRMRSPGAGAGPYCATTPCPCTCHAKGSA